MNTHTGLTIGVLLLAFGMGSLAMQVENDYKGGAKVTVKDETVQHRESTKRHLQRHTTTASVSCI